MKKRFSEEQIIGFLREAEAGMAIKDLCRRHGFSEASYYLWRSKFGGMSMPDAKRLKDLEAENTRLKKLLAEQVFQNDLIKDALQKNGERTGASCAGARVDRLWQGHGRLGACQSCAATPDPAWQTEPECLRRVLQRPAARRMPQRTLVPNAAACAHQDRTLAPRYNQHRPKKAIGAMTPATYAKQLANSDIINPEL
uniref:ISXoo3 transposase orfA n=1 Tax=Xanthomonas oryzae TaxID=347 RepID=K9MFK3_9XANT|nr:ISXoo3 transposase orfA [Xanthomonas oryzae]